MLVLNIIFLFNFLVCVNFLKFKRLIFLASEIQIANHRGYEWLHVSPVGGGGGGYSNIWAR